ncbi:hypothetical protein VYU27_007352 [Nannochloropsis oceanica]
MTATGGQAARTAELENPPPALSYEALLEENLRLKEQLQQLQQQHQRQQSQQQQQQQRKKTPSTPLSCSSSVPLPPLPPVHQLTSEHITRYSRQLLLPSFGVQGQRNLLSSSVLVVGAGGLGSAVLLYLAGAGVGRLGIVDFDGVERSNLHRQVIHTEAREGGRKAWSAAESVRALNSQVEVCVYEEEVGWDNVEGLLQGWEVVVDASDNPRTRYLLNDACWLGQGEGEGGREEGKEGRRRRGRRGRPSALVSGAALGLEGQVTVFDYEPLGQEAGRGKGGRGGRGGGGGEGEGGGGRRGGGGQGEQKLKRGPCYRCLYPKPLAAASGSCSENGVLGVVPGIIGCLQVMEVLKLLADTPSLPPLSTRLLLYDATSPTSPFLPLSLPPSSLPSCPLCSGQLLSLSACAAWADAHGLRGPGPSCPPSLPPSSLLPPEHEVTCQTLASLRQAGVPLFILDVREPHQFAICSLPGAVNIPFSSFPSSLPQEGLWERGGEGSLSATKEGGEQREGGRDVGMLGKDLAVYVMCRRGILSREATRVLVERGWGKVWNVRGGLVKWKEEVDRDFPIY